MKINVIEKPRRSGKTTQIKLSVLEELCNSKCYPRKIVYISLNEQSEKQFMKWIREIFFNTENIVIGLENLRNSLRCTSNQDYMIYIDEPFLIDERKQMEILDLIEQISKRNTVEVFATGTIEVKRLFKDYL